MHQAQTGKSEIARGPRDGSDIERIARGDEDDAQAVAFGISEQEAIILIQAAHAQPRNVISGARGMP